MMTQNQKSIDDGLTYDALAAFYFKQHGVEFVRELFLLPQFLFFRDGIIEIGDQLMAHGVRDAAEAFHQMADSFPEYERVNPYLPDNPNYGGFERGLERAERGEGESLTSLWSQARDIYRERVLDERGYGVDWRVAQWAQEEAACKAARR